MTEGIKSNESNGITSKVIIDLYGQEMNNIIDFFCKLGFRYSKYCGNNL